MEEESEKTTQADGAKTAARIIKEINSVLESKEHKSFVSEGRKIVANYRNRDTWEASASSKLSQSRVMLNVLWSNVQVLKPTLFCRIPKTVVERRFKDSDPIGRLACRAAERAVDFAINSQQDRYFYAVSSAVQDRLLSGRGQVWLRYDADFAAEVDEQGEMITDDNGNTQETVKPFSERVVIDPMYWEDWLHTPARNMYEVRAVFRRAYMTKDELKERFGEVAKKIELNTSNTAKDKSMDDGVSEKHLNQAEIWEYWDRKTKKIYWVSLGYQENILDCKEDNLRIDDFWPCPDPLLATTTSDTMYPVADYVIYKRLAEELDYVCKRLSAMVECVRLVGATAAAFNSDIKSMLSLKDGQLWPIENWQRLAESGGFDGVMDWLPFEQCLAAIPPLMQYKDDLIQEINSITGIPDVALGTGDPTETLGSQQLKSRWTVVKISDKQADVQRFCRQIASKTAQIIFEPGLFSDDTIGLMAGIAQMPPEDQTNWPTSLALLRDDRMRTFRVDIETDSTIASDEEEDKTSRMEYIGAINSLVSNLQSVSQFRPELIHPMIQSALFAARAFRTGRSMEGAWEKAMDEIETNDKAAIEAAQNQPPPPDIELMKVQNEAANIAYKNQELQRQMANSGTEDFIKQRKQDFEEWLETQKLELSFSQQAGDFDIKTQQLEIEAVKVGNKDLIDQTAVNIEKFKQNFEASIKVQRLELDKYKTVLEEKEKLIEEARLKQQEMDTRLHEISKVANSAPPAIHIHNSGAKEITMRRTADGTLVGSSRPVEDAGNV